MTFGHEQLDVYRAAVEYVGRPFRLCEGLKAHRTAKDQLIILGQRGYSVREVPDSDDADEVGSDFDSDTDPDSDIEQAR
jgi:hypothetical protein